MLKESLTKSKRQCRVPDLVLGGKNSKEKNLSLASIRAYGGDQQGRQIIPYFHDYATCKFSRGKK